MGGFAGIQFGGSEVPVLGAGRSGRAAAALLRDLGATPLLYDEKGGDEVHNSFEPALGRWPLGVVSPGFRPDHPWRKVAQDSGVSLVGELAMSAAFWPGHLLCVTGTNGKTTLTRLLEMAFRANGEEAYSCGNIGTPLSSLVTGASPNQWAVCETSSFQFYDWETPQPEIGFWTNFDEDHLDWHPSMEGYFQAKWKLVESGATVYADTSLREIAENFGCRIPKTIRWVSADDLSVCEGLFARLPFSRLYRLASAFWKESGRDMEILRRAAQSFEPLPHRMEEMGSVGGVRFINDSKATNFHAAIAACDAVASGIHWIGGGSAKGGDLCAFAKALTKRIESADLFGAVAGDLGKFLREAGVITRVHSGLGEAFQAALEASGQGKTCLFSPGFASFDQFQNYAERGDAFRQMFFQLLKGSETAHNRI